MTDMPFIEQLVRSIDGRIQALNREIAALQGARAALAKEPASARSEISTPERSARRRAPRKGRSKRAPSRLPETVEQILTESDGVSAPALADQAGADRDQVLTLLRELETTRRARRSGQGRGTRWHLITEEDWIRERAADLAARSKRQAG